MDERSWVRELRGFTHRVPGVVQGIGDDCAVLRASAREDWLVSTDMFIENVHFTAPVFTPREAGFRAVARALSDIAAMGGKPRWHLMSVAWGPHTDEKWVRGFTRGAAEAGKSCGSVLVGGDTSHAAVFTCDVTVIGSVTRGKALLRSGARPGDAIYVSGLLGGSEYGRRKGRKSRRDWRRHVRPEPRIALGQWLLGRASACMDLSDGLSLDLTRLCEASGVAATIDRPLPCWPGVPSAAALHSGEDYELLFTAPSSRRIPAEWRGLPLTRVGTIRRGKPSIEAYGEPLAVRGYDHLDR